MSKNKMEAEAGRGGVPQGKDPVAAKILETALALMECGVHPTADALLEKFPDQGPAIDAVLLAIAGYQARVKEVREERTLEGVDWIEPGSVLGDYRILGLLGSGAMGSVYRAQQVALGGREVALKVLPTALVAKDPRFLDRFRREAELASRIHSPNLAPVYGYGSDSGRVFFAMRLIEGRPLSVELEDLARNSRLGVPADKGFGHIRRVVEITRDLARALGVIHQAGFVHRDVKPSNILVERNPSSGGASSIPLEGTPILVDFGLLRSAGASELTGTMTLLGTPAYASPEHRLGRSVDARADVFSLGVVLHDMLTLVKPSERSAGSAGLMDVRTLNSGVDARLAAVLSKALENRAALRYENGQRLAEDLERWLRGKPVRALPGNPLGRLVLGMRRDPSKAMGLAVKGAALLGLAALVYSVGSVAVAGLQAKGKERSGDLLGASQDYAEVLQHPRIAALLPGFGPVIGRAKEYWPTNREENQVYSAAWASLEDPRPDSFQTLSGHLLRLVSTPPQDALWQERVFRYWAKELGEPESPERVWAAARSSAEYFLVNPLALIGADGKRAVREPWVEELEKALQELTMRAPEDSLGKESRQYATGALGGMSLESLRNIAKTLDAQEGEQRRIACYSSIRVWERFRVANEEAYDDLLLKLDQSILSEWAAAAWHSARKFEAILQRSGEYYSSDPTHASWPDFIAMVQIGGKLLSVVAEARSQLRQAGRLGREWDLPVDLLARLNQLEMQIAHLEDGCRTLKPGCSVGERFLGWPDAELQSGTLESWNFGYLHEEVFLTTLHSNGSVAAYTDTRDGSLPRKSGSVHADSIGPDCTEGAAHFEDGEVVLSGSATRFNWTGGQVVQFTPQALELDSPLQSECSLFLQIPKGTRSATVSAFHLSPARPLLPGQGQTTIEISTGNGALKVIEVLNSVRNRLNFTLPWTALQGLEELELKIRYLDATALYWLFELSVEFSEMNQS